jgi:hypothetical protein
MPLYEVPLPNGTIVEIEGPPGVERQVQARAREYFRSAFPQEFESWRRTQVGLGSSITQGASRAVDEFQGQLYSAAEGLGQSLNMPSLQQFGREGRIEQALQAEAAQPQALRTPILESQGPGDVGRAAAEIVTGSLPQTATGIGGALAGARLGARAGARGALLGGFLGASGAGYLPTAGANIQRKVEEEAKRLGVTPAEVTQIPNPGESFIAAIPQVALESAADIATLGAGRFLGRPVGEAAGSLGQRLLRGAGVGAATEPLAEVPQAAIERYQAGLPITGPEANREYLEAGLGGAIAGGVLGGAARGAFGARPTPEAAPAPEAAPEPAPVPRGSVPAVGVAPTPPVAEAAPTPEPAPAPRFEPLTMPTRPEPLASVDQVEAFLAENPRFTPPVPLATPEATVAFVNAARVADWQQASTDMRQRAIDEFVAKPPQEADAETVAPSSRQAQASDFISNLAENAQLANVNLNSFTPADVARAALGARDLDPGRPSRAEQKAVSEQLNALADAGFLRKLSPKTFAVATEPVAPAPPTQTDVQQEIAAFNEQLATGTLTPETMQRMGAEVPAAPIQPQDEAALWRGYSLNAGPQARSPFVAQARNIAAIRQRPFTRPEFIDFAQQSSAAATPEARDQVYNDFINRRQAPTQAAAPQPAPTPAGDTPAAAAAAADPQSGAGKTTDTVEEALFSPPDNAPIKNLQASLDKQIVDGFRGGFMGKWFASPIATYSKNPIYKGSADQLDRFYVRNHQALTQSTEAYEPALRLSAESQARIALTLQDARSKQQMWDRSAFTPEENAAMDGILRSFQSLFNFYVDSSTASYFNPALAKTAEDRARLEAFQRKKGDRLIGQMPDEEVRAASPIGHQEVKRYERRRDAFFFPQIAQGSHFVAAYEKLPGNKKRLVRIYFYDPARNIRRVRQAVGLQRNFEDIAVKRLREEFPDSKRFYVMERGMEATRDENANNLRRDGDFIAQWLQELSKVSGAEAKQVIDRMTKEIKKAQMERMFRPNNDLLRAVTPENATDYIRDTVPNYIIAASKLQAREAVRDDFNNSLDGYSNEEKQYWNDTFNYASTPTEAFGTGRALAFLWFLGFNFSTAVIQFTQNPTVMVPRLLRDGAGASALRYSASAAKDVYGTLDVMKSLGKELDYTKKLIDRGVLTADEVTALRRAVKDGRINPVQAVELRSTFSADEMRKAGIADKSATTFAKNANKILDLSGKMLSAVDETNRVTAFLAAYRLAKARPEVMARASKLDNRNYATPYDYAEGVTSDTNFRSTKEDRALIQRFHPIAEAATQFQGPVFKILELYTRSAAQTIRGLRQSDPVMAKAGAIQFAAMLSTQVALAGIWSLPLAERIRELAEFILKLAFENATDFEQELERALGNGFMASMFSYGLPHASGTLSLNSRLKIDPLPQGSVSDWDVLSFFGPVGGLASKAVDTFQAWKKGDPWGAMVSFMPNALANIAKGAEIAVNKEQWTRGGERMISPADVDKAAQSGFLPPAIQQAIGFVPPEFADIRRGATRVDELRRINRDPTERANLELSRLLLRALEARAAGREQDVERFYRDYQKRYAEIAQQQESKPVAQRVNLNPQAILDRAQKDYAGRGNPAVLTRQTRVPAREEAARIAEEARWRERQ